MTDSTLEAVLRRDRLVVAGALGLIAALAWGYVLWLAADMDMGGMDMDGFRMIPAGMGIMAPANAPWKAIEFAFVFAMWAVMMVGMMAPSAAPMILMYARVGRQGRTEGKPLAATGWFAAGYFSVWIGFSLAATLFQFLMRYGGFRGDVAGCLLLGLRHGAFCVGCCWVLMALLFVGGVMNVLWIALLALFVLLEKLTPVGRLIARAVGVACVVAGARLLLFFPQ